MPPPDHLLPARMVNEFVYCPRLFYFEHVEGVFRHNADTLAGKAAHGRVDTPAPGALPAANGEAKPAGKKGKGKAAAEPEAPPPPEEIHARSVNLFSDRLGVTAKLDLVEAWQGGEDLFAALVVQPVEYKKGRPRDGEDGPEVWDADRVQLGLQILLLRDNGYQCPGGVLYYRETRQRVEVPYSIELENWVLAQIKGARACARGPRPPPLVDSPKCPRCSLVTICLPDESRWLAEEPAAALPSPQLDLALFEDPFAEPVDVEIVPPRVEELHFLPEIRLQPPKPPENLRRLIAPNDETKALYLQTPGHWVGKKGEEIQVKEEGKVVAEFRLMDLHHVAVFGAVQISTAVLQALCEREAPITWFTGGGWFWGIMQGHTQTNVFTRIAQFRVAADREQSLALARLIVYGKVRNQRTLLMRNHRAPPKQTLRLMKYLAGAALHATSLPVLLGIEGSAALAYFDAFTGMLKGGGEEGTRREGGTELDFALRDRNRRPPRDPINALLSFLYSLLSKDATLACHAAGFDPYIGFYHQPRYGRPALALDLMEEFRPIVADSVVLTLVNNRMISPSDFIRAGDGVSLSPAARRTVIEAYETRLRTVVTHPVFDYKVSYRRALELQARILAKCVTGEIPHYLPFTTR